MIRLFSVAFTVTAPAEDCTFAFSMLALTMLRMSATPTEAPIAVPFVSVQADLVHLSLRDLDTSLIHTGIMMS